MYVEALERLLWRRQGVRAEDCTNHLHQLHICLPSRPGHTRLLYRMSMDFLNWTRHVPGIQAFWEAHRWAGERRICALCALIA